MESELLRIKCPNCGAVLTIKKIAGLETKSIPCPVCKKASKYIDYKVPKQQYTPPNENDDTTMGDETHIDHSKNQSIGKLQKIVNSDPNAPINTIADYVINGTVEEVVPKLIKYYKKNSK